MKHIENVVVNNGFVEHNVQYTHSPNNIVNCANMVISMLNQVTINKINDNNLKVIIKTNSDYSRIEYSELITDDYELKYVFNEQVRF